MADDAVGDGARYWAFISYSHKDAAFGRRLHRRLENYALPRRLAGRATPRGIVPRRLTPIFRDREELPAAHDLSVEVRAALAASRSLIVVCSPSAAASPWVSREVELFRALHPDRPILAALAKGEPGESFPSALHGTLADGTIIEPLAADFRREGDGAQAALLKLVAGIAGIGLDELVQRDAQRNLQRVTAVTATALLAMLVMGLLTIFAFRARTEAERQRGEAEGLVAFMTTDLRDRLSEVGRLDAMVGVNQKALDYFNDEDAVPGPNPTHAQVLLSVASVADATGHDSETLRRSREAYAITAELLKQAPGDPKAIFNHAQSEYWLGYSAYSGGNYKRAKIYFDDYIGLARRLVAIDPKDARYLRELAFAEGDLCSLALAPPKDPDRAIPLCESALAHVQQARRQKNASSTIEADLVNRESWLATAYRGKGDNKHAKAHFLVEEQLLASLMARNPLNMVFRRDWIAAQRLLATIEAAEGQPDHAAARLRGASNLIDEMVLFDPDNKKWAELKKKIERELQNLNSKKNEGKTQ